MAYRALTNGVIAASLVLSVTASLSPTAAAAPPVARSAASAAVTGAADPVVVPAALRSSVQPFTLVSTGGAREADAVGKSGVFSRVPGKADYRWTRFSDGAHFPAGPTGSGTVTRMYGTGTDTIAYLRADGVELRDMVAGTTELVSIPEGLTFSGVYGRTVVAVKVVSAESGGTTSTSATEAHLLDVGEDGTTRDRTVTGLPEGAKLFLSQAAAAGDESGVLLRYVHEGVGRMAMVDVETARMTGGAAHIGGAAPGYLLTPRHVVWYSYGADSTISVVPRSDIGATPRVLTAPAPTERNSYHIAVVGDWLLHNRGGSALTATPLDGGASRQLLREARTEIASAQDGSAVVVGGATGYADDATWGVYRIVEGQDGVPVPTRVVDLSALPVDLEGIGLAVGKLTVAGRSGTLRKGTERQLEVQGTPAYGSAVDSFISFVSDCGPQDPDCYAIHNARSGEPVVLNRQPSGAGDEVRISGQGSIRTGLSGGTLTDTDGDYSVYTHPASNQQIVYRGSNEKVLTRTPVASAVWAGTLWSAGTKPGTVTAYDLGTRRTTGTVDLGSACTPHELQALGRWLYWTCEESGRAGVLDRTTGKRIAVPVGEALLGDGYLVRHDKAAGKLELTDLVSAVAGGAAEGRVVADLPATVNPQRRVAWTVDEYGGHLAYVDAGQRVHIVPTGVPTQPLSAYDEEWTGRPGAAAYGSWMYRGKFSKPASSWKAVFKDLRTGKTVRTVTGGEKRGGLGASWEGRTDAGSLAVNGRYGWTLTVQPADGHGAPLVRRGEFALTQGAPAWRDFGRDGLGDLFVVVDEGSLGQRNGRLPGTVGPLNGYWGIEDTAAKRIVPTGDMGGDGCNDLLAAKNDGTLLRIDGPCDSVATGPIQSVQIGSGWKAYDMFAPGDINGDGIADLLARQRSTGYLFLYPGDGKGRLKARTQIGVGWNGLTVVAAGDLTGDGFGDLLVRDKAGVLWRYAGTGTGRVAPKVRISAGWQLYDAFAAVGDVTGDGKNDLFARDSAGVLWRYTGTGTGTFGARAKVGPGWMAYPTVF